MLYYFFFDLKADADKSKSLMESEECYVPPEKSRRVAHSAASQSAKNLNRVIFAYIKHFSYIVDISQTRVNREEELLNCNVFLSRNKDLHLRKTRKCMSHC